MLNHQVWLIKLDSPFCLDGKTIRKFLIVINIFTSDQSFLHLQFIYCQKQSNLQLASGQVLTFCYYSCYTCKYRAMLRLLLALYKKCPPLLLSVIHCATTVGNLEYRLRNTGWSGKRVAPQHLLECKATSRDWAMEQANNNDFFNMIMIRANGKKQAQLTNHWRVLETLLS